MFVKFYSSWNFFTRLNKKISEMKKLAWQILIQHALILTLTHMHRDTLTDRQEETTISYSYQILIQVSREVDQIGGLLLTQYQA